MRHRGAAGLRPNLRPAAVLTVSIAISLSLAGCKPHSTDQEARLAAPYSPTAGAVLLNILPVHNTEGSQTWLATYMDESGTTRFRIELDPPAKSNDKSFLMSSGKGRFLAEVGSNPIPLLESLKKALQAKHMPTKARKTEELPFDYVIIGENQTRSADGGFAEKPKGTWTAMKIFLPHGKDEGEVYLNIDAVGHQAEFSIKDSDYGDAVLQELANVF
jgi:hypothetical protein